MLFPFLFGGTFIEGSVGTNGTATHEHFPSFSEGLSLRAVAIATPWLINRYFPSFSEGLSLRACAGHLEPDRPALHFPSFSEGLSLRVRFAEHALTSQRRFPFLFGRAFIEAPPMPP